MILKGNTSMGAFSLNDLAASIFGENNVETLKTQAQASATSLALNAAGKYVQTNPDAIKALSDSGSTSLMESLDKVWAEYKIPVIIAGVLVSGIFGYAIYNMIMSGKKVAVKSNPTSDRIKGKIYDHDTISANGDYYYYISDSFTTGDLVSFTLSEDGDVENVKKRSGKKRSSSSIKKK